MNPEELLTGLNQAQKAAVTHGEGPLMIIAGAGTGKTMAITRRLAYLVATGAAQPAELLALTFTEKAAKEMEERVDRLLPMGYVDLSIGTFHGFCERVLREFGVHIGLSPDFRVLTDVESWLLLRRHIGAMKLEYFAPRGNPTKFLQALLTHISRAKDEGIEAAGYAAYVAGFVAPTAEGLNEEDRLERAKWLELARVYTVYADLMAKEDALDFGDLLLLTKKLFVDRPNILRTLQERYKYLVVDEFQDTNRVQYDLVKLLAGSAQNLTIVGDDDQAIYKFRGAALANILQFRQDFPTAVKVVLTDNYRSHAAILNVAYTGIIQNNPHRLEVREGLDKKLAAKGEVEGGFVRHFHEATQEQEITRVVLEMQKLVGSGGATWQDMAVLARSNDALQPYIETFDRLGIPFHYVGLDGLYTKGIILDLWAVLRVIVDPSDGPAWYRVLTRSKGGLAAADMNAIGALARKHAWPMQVAVERALGEAGVSLEGKNLLAPLLQQFVAWREESKRCSAVEMVVKVVQQAGFLEEAMAEGEVLAREQFRYLDQFLSRAKRSVREHADEPGLAGFLADLAAEREAGETGAVRQDEEQGPDAIQLMTVHAAKGLEFRYVFVVSLLEQRFPSVSRSDTLPLPPGLVPVDAELDDHVAEERRLFYVAVTRAKEGLYLCSAEDYGGARARKPSRFVAEAGLTAEDRLEDLPEFSAQTQSAKDAARGIKIDQAPLPKQFSFSQLAAFSNCPQQYKYAHLIKIPTPPRWQMTFGTCMHNTMQRFLEQVQTSQQTAQADLFTPATTALPPLSTLMGLYDQYFTDEWYESVDFREETRALGRTALLDLYARMEQVPPRPAFLEQGFTLKLDDILVKGRIDRIDAVDGGYEIIDYKTGEPKTELNADDKRQLTLYAIAAEECFSPPLKIVRCTYHYFKGNVQASFTPTPAEKDKLKLQIRETVAQMKASDFTATPNPRLCQYCDFKLICPFAIL